jgi:hypothetical protein
MSKKIKIFIAAGLAVLLLVAGIGIPVLAAAGDPSPTPPVAITTQEGVIDRTAKILGITTDALINAVKQAKETFKEKKPTADEFFAKVAELHGNGMTKEKLVSALQQAGTEIAQERINTGLDNAAKNGKITADEAKEIKDWLAARPSAVDKLFGGLRGFGGRCWGRFKGGFGGFGGFGPFKGGPRNQAPGASPSAFTYSEGLCPACVTN